MDLHETLEVLLKRLRNIFRNNICPVKARSWFGSVLSSLGGNTVRENAQLSEVGLRKISDGGLTGGDSRHFSDAGKRNQPLRNPTSVIVGLFRTRASKETHLLYDAQKMV